MAPGSGWQSTLLGIGAGGGAIVVVGVVVVGVVVVVGIFVVAVVAGNTDVVGIVVGVIVDFDCPVALLDGDAVAELVGTDCLQKSDNVSRRGI